MKNSEIKDDKKIISFQERVNEKGQGNPIFSTGLYNWIMFVIGFYSRVRETLKIDYDSFIIIQVVVSQSLYELNKKGSNNFEDLERLIIHNTSSHTSKLTYASISDILNLPRETVRRKVLALCKANILNFDDKKGIKLGPLYQTIYKDFVSKTTLDISTLVKKWEKSGALNKLLDIN